MWGDAPIDVSEVNETFAKYVQGEIPYLPWCEVPLQAETGTITDFLVRINRAGYLTINSQVGGVIGGGGIGVDGSDSGGVSFVSILYMVV